MLPTLPTLWDCKWKVQAEKALKYAAKQGRPQPWVKAFFLPPAPRAKADTDEAEPPK
jgi:hypothetical protein